MLSNPAGVDILREKSERGGARSLSPRPGDLHIPKNRSTGNLLAHSGTEKARIRFSFDAGAAAEYDMSRLVRSVRFLDGEGYKFTSHEALCVSDVCRNVKSGRLTEALF